MSRAFQFKQFTVHQSKAAMKVGTDGVLLGAWVRINQDVRQILDIGSGTGLIALMMAQRSDAEVIDAVEMVPEAYVESVENFERSEWGDRLFCYHAPIQEYAEEMEEEYDLIVSNPPFFASGSPTAEMQRSWARQQEKLTFDALLTAADKLLSANGSAAFIIPAENEEKFLEIASGLGLFPQRLTRVKGTESSIVKRSLLQLGRTVQEIEPDTLIIEISRHEYTKEFKALVKDFYLKM